MFPDAYRGHLLEFHHLRHGVEESSLPVLLEIGQIKNLHQRLTSGSASTKA